MVTAMSSPHHYTPEERQFFEEYTPGHHYSEIRDEFVRRFGWEITLVQVKGYLGNHHLRCGINGCFEKGHVPANKGKPMPPEIREKAAATMFRKGHTPYNTAEIGEIRDIGGYLYVKVDNQPKVRKLVNWRKLHYQVWEEANGPVPEGCIITFVDGDPHNVELSNLMCISQSDHAVMNHVKLRGSDRDTMEMGVATSKIIRKLAEIDNR